MPAPVEVVASFARLQDNVGPRLVALLDSLGYHQGMMHSDTASQTIGAELHVEQVSESYRRAQVYSATATYMVHAHQRLIGGAEGMASPEFLALRFALLGDSARWVLLTDDGYPFSLAAESRRNDLPLDEQVAIRNLFPDRMEFRTHVDSAMARLQVVRAIASPAARRPR